jgi:hypothetical protein
VALGGAGFAASLGSLALLLAPSPAQAAVDPNAAHPPFFLRVRLIVEMLRRTAVDGHAAVADELDGIWATLSKPAWADPFLEDAAGVASHFLTTAVPALNGHAILELNPDAARDHRRTSELAAFLRSGHHRPEPAAAAGMHPRLVAPAAQLALRIGDAGADDLRHIHTAAIEYLRLIPQVPTLGPEAALMPPRRQYLKELTARLDFGRMGASMEE